MTPTSSISTSSAGTTALDATAAAEKAKKRAELEKVANGFEAIFTRQLMSSMRGASLDEDSDSASVQQFQSMQDSHLAEGMAKQGGLGIAQLILQQLDKKS